MTTENSFPYGNDLSHPERWAGLANAKSSSWLIGYDSGWSLVVGAHTFLFFGKENLVAFAASVYGAGLSAGYGAAKAAKRVERGAAQSVREAQNLKIPEEYGVSKKLEKIEKAKEKKDIKDWADSKNEKTSALEIYKKLHSQTNGFEALKPFSYNDLDWTMGVVSGVAADVAIGSATYYITDAKDLFKGVNAFNIKDDTTIITASLGSLWGVWRTEKFYSLWDELAYSEKEEHPFSTLDVHEFFRNWKSPRYDDYKKAELFQKQDKITRAIAEDMQKNPSKYGFADEFQALQKVVQLNEGVYANGRAPGTNPYLPWVPASEKHLFYESY